ncbi:outer membrane lipoprotein carrier protein LolA [uncultured Desulfosarcina sp.]|uniref:LolA family protein n=1 Tax=uncultured Desulfosarcina sp. TaxID=218289 RepID=UPI0029C72812|nr:outer membrane lipoprotein carrier protein LolA [uncultured Desulfosarcina sp.]
MKNLRTDGRKSILIVIPTIMLAIAWSLAQPLPASAGDKTIDTIIAGVEARYNVPGFTADFEQESILKAMAVTDTASGRLMVRQPGKMRWEYLVPDPQTIITDGNDLWIYRPQENQVLVGKAPSFFGEGKGAGFLSNIKTVRKSFQLSLEPAEDATHYRLKLLPNKSSVDLMAVELDIAKKTFNLVRITTFNVYGDETRIELKNVNFNDPPPEELFRFSVPEGADVLKMNP